MQENEVSTTVEMGNDMNTESSIRSQSNGYNASTEQKQLPHEIYNSAVNLPVIRRLIAEGRARDVNDEPKAGGVPFFVIGSGPSLDTAIPHLKDWRGGIICSPSHALTLMHSGIEPTHIMALDPFECWDEVKGVDWSKTRTKLVTHPGVWPDLIEKWPNDMLLYRQNSGRPDSYYATTQKLMYADREGDRNKSVFTMLIRTEVTIFSCSPPLQLFVGDRMGYGTAFLAGLDFGFHSGKNRFTSYTVSQEEKNMELGNTPPVVIPAEWEKHVHPYVRPPKDAPDQPITCNNGSVTDTILLYYKKNFISAWRLHGKAVYTTDRHDLGTITEIPYMSIHKVVTTQGRKATKRPEKWVHKQADRYLASIGCFVVQTAEEKPGYNFIESQNPEIELNDFMVKMKRKLTCKVCGIEAVPNDNQDHVGDECPNCKQGKLERLHDVDVGANMNRIRDLIKYTKDHK